MHERLLARQVALVEHPHQQVLACGGRPLRTQVVVEADHIPVEARDQVHEVLRCAHRDPPVWREAVVVEIQPHLGESPAITVSGLADVPGVVRLESWHHLGDAPLARGLTPARQGAFVRSARLRASPPRENRCQSPPRRHGGFNVNEWSLTPVPAWLAAVTAEGMQHAPFPLEEVLDGALYYPSSAFDGTVVEYLAPRVHSFVHVDYSLTRAQLTDELAQRGFRGYEVLGRRAVTQEELVPGGWTLPPLQPGDGDPRRAMRHGTPFCDWIIFDRLLEFGDEHGPSRFSLLHMNADGAAAFDALYRSNGFAPSAVAIIQPGHGSGGNWTHFENPDATLGRLVLGNPAGLPTWLLFGGAGGCDFYREPCWPTHSQFMGVLGNTSIGVWRKSS
jgi:hypothetical protein